MRVTAALGVALALTPPSLAAGGSYVFVGGTSYERQQVTQALAASSFDWSAVPQTVTITIQPNVVSQAVPGHIWLDSNLLDSGEFSWGVVQNEYAHQVDFYLLDDLQRAQLTSALGAAAWCYGDAAGLTLEQYGCERFASTLAVAYWQSPYNCIGATSDVAPIAPAAFRALLVSLIGPAARPAASTEHLNGTRRRTI